MTLLRKIILWGMLSIANISANASNIGFSGSEHIAVGDDIILHPFVTPNHDIMLLTLPNGLKLSYGSILSLGDFYGTVNQPIALGKSKKNRQARFLKAFAKFSTEAYALSEVPTILNAMHDEKIEIETGILNHESEKTIFTRMGFKFERRYSCITGGSCSDKTWWMYPGRYLKLAFDNFDHFGQHAIIAYKTGHQLAIEEAIQAYSTHDLQRLEIAYAMNAFASHFLSDRFASGHIRTPRLKLSHSIASPLVAGLLAGLMHNEDNEYGLHVGNLRGEEWVTYGDRAYFFTKNNLSNQKQREALQSSADEIYFTYQHGYAPPSQIVDELIPYQNAALGHLDTAPLFYWDTRTKTLMRRQNLDDPYDTHFTRVWLSWPTLVALAKGKNMQLPEQEPRS